MTGSATLRPSPGPGPQAAPGRLTGIDHVALAAPFDRFDDSVLFLRAVLGLEPGRGPGAGRSAGPGPQPHPDLTGRVRGRGADRAEYAAAGRPGRPGAQHVAFSCDDAFAVSAALRAAGAPLLAIPENYYEDLQARLDLD